MTYFAALFAPLFIALSASASSLQIIDTKYGPVSGVRKAETTSFLGIPYARPPIGNLRWKAPQEPLPWQNIFVANKYSNSCAQIEMQSKKMIGSEDCLTLNIWKPTKITRPLPVLFFIHGGANTIGSSNQEILGQNLYHGENLAEKDVIVVTINYRLGALGFLTHPHLKNENLSSGNFAILDQLQALRFVQENIQNFGGDPRQVTIFGESAGAINSLVLIASPLSQGLFSKAIIQSGFLGDRSLDVAQKSGQDFAIAAGCSNQEASCLRSLSVEKILQASVILSKTPLLTENATIDGYVLKKSVLETMRSGGHQKIPVIIGSNREEMRTLLIGLVPAGTIVSERVYREILTGEFGVEKTEKILQVYPAKNYLSPRIALEEALGDFAVHCPTRQIVRALETHQKQVYRYIFSHVPDSPLLWALGAGHALELPFVFGNLSLLRSLPEHLLSDQIQNYWIQFASFGNPNSTSAPYWPDSKNESYLDLKHSSEEASRFHSDQCDFWDKF